MLEKYFLAFVSGEYDRRVWLQKHFKSKSEFVSSYSYIKSVLKCLEVGLCLIAAGCQAVGWLDQRANIVYILTLTIVAQFVAIAVIVFLEKYIGRLDDIFTENFFRENKEEEIWMQASLAALSDRNDSLNDIISNINAWIQPVRNDRDAQTAIDYINQLDVANNQFSKLRVICRKIRTNNPNLKTIDDDYNLAIAEIDKFRNAYGDAKRLLRNRFPEEEEDNLETLARLNVEASRASLMSDSE